MAPTTDVQKSSRIPEWDGVRGLAILLVVFYHYIYGAIPEDAGGAGGLIRTVFPLSWSGVDLFFVLSGFLIGGILMNQYGSGNYFKTFYIRRVCRIVPLYFAWLILFLVIAGLIAANASEWVAAIFNREIPHFPRWGYFLFLQNLATAKTGLYGSPWLSATWSLAVEEQFYLLLPLLLWFVRPNRRLPILIFLIALVPAFRIFLFLFHSSVFVYVLLPCRADALLLGVLCAYLVREPKYFAALQRHRSWLATAFMILFVGVGALTAYVRGHDSSSFDSFNMISFGFTWMAMFYASLLLLVATSPASVAARFFRIRILQHFGLLAYGMFLMHMAIDSIAHGVFFEKSTDIKNFSDAAVTALAFLATWGLALLSWKFFEQPIIKWGHSFRYDSHEKTAEAGGVTVVSPPSVN